MSKRSSVAEIAAAVLCGIEKSHHDYEKMSGGSWLWEAPEYLLTANVAYAIRDIGKPGYITLEYGSRQALEDAGALGQGKLHFDLRDAGKLDLVLWWASEVPRAVIEVKNQTVSRGEVEKDLKRIWRFLERKSEESSIQFGMFAFYISAASGARKTSADKISDRIKVVSEIVRGVLPQNYRTKIYKSVMHKHGETDAWQAVCLQVSRGGT